MALKLHVPPCIHTPRQPHHAPPLEKPLRLHIQGPLVCIQKLFPSVKWAFDWEDPNFQAAAPLLARSTHEAVYGRALTGSEKITVRDQYLGWISRALDIDYYGVTFDHLVGESEEDPDVLALNLIEIDYDGGAFAREVLPFHIDTEEYRGKKVLAVPRCCQKKRGKQDRSRINGEVQWRASEGYVTRLDVRGSLGDGEEES